MDNLSQARALQHKPRGQARVGTRLHGNDQPLLQFILRSCVPWITNTKTMHTSSTPNALAGNPFWLDVLESAHVLKSARVLAIIIIIIIKFYRTTIQT